MRSASACSVASLSPVTGPPCSRSAHQPVRVASEANSSLAQALANLGGAPSASGNAARNAYSSGFALAMIVGVVVAVAAATVYLALPATEIVSRPQTRPSAPSPGGSPSALT